MEIMEVMTQVILGKWADGGGISGRGLTHCVDTSQPLFSPLPLPGGLMNKLAQVAGTGVMHGLSNMDCHSPMSTQLWAPLNTLFASSRDK